MFSLLKKATLIFLTTSWKLSARMGILMFGFNVSLIVNFGLNFLKVSLTKHDAISTIFTKANIQGVFKQFSTKSFFSRAFQAPLKSKIKFQGFSRTSRSSMNPVCIAKSRKLVVKLFEQRHLVYNFSLIPARKQSDWHKLKTIFIH